ncbi:MAG: FxDxF family PEP-CTERM protein [Burkholderiaceae bacterium]|nr:FxDxF family PEP-CTERM protein [Burkholderiaceae bacterium]
MKLHQRFLCAIALAGATSLSWAAPPDPVPLMPAGPGLYLGGFTQAVDGLFIDTFSFMPAAFDGLVSVTLSSLAGPVSFFTASLNGQDFSYFPELGQTDFMFQAQVTSSMPLSLTVFGAVLDGDGNPLGAGSYSGAITVAVPEVQSYALMLAGLAGLALAARRRRKA